MKRPSLSKLLAIVEDPDGKAVDLTDEETAALVASYRGGSVCKRCDGTGEVTSVSPSGDPSTRDCRDCLDGVS